MSTTKILIALSLVLAPASLGLAAVTGAVDLPGLTSQTAAPEDAFGGEVVETFEKSFDQEITDGTVDLRVEDGRARVVGWAQNAYKVVVLQAGDTEAEVTDHETEITFQDGSSGSTLDLQVIVERSGTYAIDQDGQGISTGDQVELAIVAFVPQDATYEEIYACSGQESFLSEAYDTVSSVLGSLVNEEPEGRACVPAPAQPQAFRGTISVNDQRNQSRLNVASGAANVTGQQLLVLAEFGDLDLTNVTFETATALSEHGDVTATDVDVDALTLHTEFGDLQASGQVDAASLVTEHGDLEVLGSYQTLAAGSEFGDIVVDGQVTDLEATTEHGSIDATLAAEESGSWIAASEFGNVEVHVPRTQASGYAVDAATEFGEVTIALLDTPVTRQSDEDDHKMEKHARTQGFEDRQVQITLEAITEHGDVLVTDGSEELKEDEEASDQPEPGDQNEQLLGPPVPVHPVLD